MAKKRTCKTCGQRIKSIKKKPKLVGKPAPVRL